MLFDLDQEMVWSIPNGNSSYRLGGTKQCVWLAHIMAA